MEISDFIQLGILVVAIASIVVTHIMDAKQRKLQMFAEYTRRYQDIFMNMPDDIYNGTAKIDTRTKRYMRLYFDLCSEEFHLWQNKEVPDEVWNLWVEVCKLLAITKYTKILGMPSKGSITKIFGYTLKEM